MSISIFYNKRTDRLKRSVLLNLGRSEWQVSLYGYLITIFYKDYPMLTLKYLFAKLIKLGLCDNVNTSITSLILLNLTQKQYVIFPLSGQLIIIKSSLLYNNLMPNPHAEFDIENGSEKKTHRSQFFQKIILIFFRQYFLHRFQFKIIW